MVSYTAPKATVQQMLQKYHSSQGTSANLHVQKVLNRLKICRTASLDYHVYGCGNDGCGQINYQYHSCRAGIVLIAAHEKNKNGQRPERRNCFR
ncbi:MAG: hypothetical protein C4308_14430 [Chitinophagaceae bacterium]